MKYGLMYYKATDNIGDDIQTYVAKKYLPHIDYYIDREALSCFIPKEKEYVSMIMNGWYIHNKIAWPPSPYINPLLISMHFRKIEKTDIGDYYLKSFGGKFLNKYGPVGARDIETQKRLRKNGIEAYFSGCMTLTLEKFKNIEKKNKICLVDLDEEVILNVQKNTEYDIEILSHYLDSKETEKKTIEERMNNVEELLKKYQESHLVITTRLHAALPCVALDVPVILLHKEIYDEDRLGIFLEYIDSYEQSKFLDMDIKEILKNPKKNNKKYLIIKDNINKRCKDFIARCERIQISDINKLPEIESYSKYVERIKWYKDIYEKERLALENIQTERAKEYQINQNEFIRLNNEIKMLSQENINLRTELLNNKNSNFYLTKELGQIYNSKGWRYLERLRKIYRVDKR